LTTFGQEDDDDDDMLQPTTIELLTMPLRARRIDSSRLRHFASPPRSPILLGRLATCQGGDWDGGLLAQPVNSDLLSLMLHTPDTKQLLSRFDKSGDDQSCGDNANHGCDSDSMLNDEYGEYDNLLDMANSLPDDNDSLLDYDYEESDSLLLGSIDEQEDDEEVMYPLCHAMSIIPQYSSSSLAHRLKQMNNDDNDSLLLPEYADTWNLQRDEDHLARDNSSILVDSDSSPQEAEDTNMPISSQESSLTVNTIYSDTNDATRHYYDHAYFGEADNNIDEDIMTDTMDNNWHVGWRRCGGMMIEEDEDMLGADLGDSDEKMLAF